jgi:hypothetical protein
METLHAIGPHSAEHHCQGCHSDTVLVQVLDVWTSNAKGRPKKRFSPGQKIRFNAKFRIICNPEVQHKVRLWGEAFGLPDKEWEIPLSKKRAKLYTGEYIKSWKEIVPLNAVPGTEAKVRVRMKVVNGGITPYTKGKFKIK